MTCLASNFYLLVSSIVVDVGGFLLLAIWFWVLHFAVTMVLASPFLWYGIDRVDWNRFDLMATFVPFGLWTAFMAFDERSPYTALYLCVVIAAAAAIRVAVGRRPHQRTYSAILLVLICAAGLGMYFYGHYWPALFLWE